jgi:DNA primase
MKHYYEERGIEYDWVTDIYNVILDCSNFHPGEGFSVPKYESLRNKFGRVKREVELPAYNEGALGTFVKHYPPEWLREGISTAAMDKFGICYSISQNKIIIPHYDVKGRLVGIRGRALNEWEIENVGKYMPVRLEQTWYKHPLSMNLYGLYENQENIRKTGICYVFESEKSVLQFEAFGMPNCAVAVCGSQFNKYQLNVLLRNVSPREIVICFDSEEKAEETKYFDKLWALCQKYKQYANFSFIYDRLGLLNLKDSPSDRGEETFKKLLEKRTRVK